METDPESDQVSIMHEEDWTLSSWKRQTILWMVSWTHSAILNINGVYYSLMISLPHFPEKENLLPFIWIVLFLILRPNFDKDLKTSWKKLSCIICKISKYSLKNTFNLISSHSDIIFKQNERHIQLSLGWIV